jgi:hypothetical protein
MNDSSSLPYEMHPPSGGGFTIFESADAVALPLLHLSKATLRGAGGLRMSLEFSSALVVVEGEGLAELFGHLLAGRVKTLRVGRHADCALKVIQILDT